MEKNGQDLRALVDSLHRLVKGYTENDPWALRSGLQELHKAVAPKLKEHMESFYIVAEGLQELFDREILTEEHRSHIYGVPDEPYFESPLFLGNGLDSAAECRLLHGMLEEALSTSSGLQQMTGHQGFDEALPQGLEVLKRTVSEIQTALIPEMYLDEDSQ